MTKPSVTWITWDGEPASQEAIKATIAPAAYWYGWGLGRWSINRPENPGIALAEVTQLCSKLSGVFIPRADRMVNTNGLDFFLPGISWCQLRDRKGKLFFIGGWMDADALSRPENLTPAAGGHVFFVHSATGKLSSADTAQEPKQIGHIFERYFLDEVRQRPGMSNKLSEYKVNLRADPAQGQCALIDLTYEDILSPALGDGSKRNETIWARFCVRTDRWELLAIMETYFSTDPDAERRGRVVRNKIGRALASMSSNGG